MRPALLSVFVAVALATPVMAGEHTGTLEKIKATGTIVLGHRDASPPFSFLDADKKPVGYSVDLCQRVAAAVKETLGLAELTVKFVPVSAEDRVTKVADGTIDMECGNTTKTLSRQTQVDFTLPTFITGASLLVPADSKITAVSDLRGQPVSVVSGTTTEQALDAALQLQTPAVSAVVKVKDHNQGLQLLETGQVQAHAGDQIVLIGLARGSKDPGKLALATELFTYEPYALMIRRNDADFRLVADRTLAQLYRTGEISSVYDKWFGDWGGRPSRLLLAMFALNGLPE
jgi:ABC-type amino acid transport substrate-binding protein